MWGKELTWRSRKIAATTPPLPTESRRFLGIPEKFCYYTPPPPNRVGFRRSRKRLKKFNNLNLAALPTCSRVHFEEADRESIASTSPYDVRYICRGSGCMWRACCHARTDTHTCTHLHSLVLAQPVTLKKAAGTSSGP